MDPDPGGPKIYGSCGSRFRSGSATLRESPFWWGGFVNLVSVASGPLIRICGVSLDASFHGGSSDTISGRVWFCLQEISLFFVLRNFRGLRGLWSGCLGCLWILLFMAVQMTPSMDVFKFGRYNAFTVCCFLNKLFRNKIVKMLNPEFEEEPPFKLSLNGQY